MNKLLAKILNKFIYHIDYNEENIDDKKSIDKNECDNLINREEFNNNIANLINNVFKKDLPDEVKGMAFIIHYLSKDYWEIDILGTYNKEFKPTDKDWACERDYTALSETYMGTVEVSRNLLFETMESVIRNCLSEGEYSEKLKSLEAIGLCFDDGNINFLYLNQ